jgi:hypothetical protein
MKNIILTIASVLAFTAQAQENFKSNIEFYGHQYKRVEYTGNFAKWVIDEEKSWYLAPDSTTSQLMTVQEWEVSRRALKTNGFNEIDPKYYWNPKTKTVVMLVAGRHERTGLLHVSTEYGTDIR